MSYRSLQWKKSQLDQNLSRSSCSSRSSRSSRGSQIFQIFQPYLAHASKQGRYANHTVSKTHNFVSLKSEAEGLKFLELIFDRVPGRAVLRKNDWKPDLFASANFGPIEPRLVDSKNLQLQLLHVTRDGDFDARVPQSGLRPRQRLRQRQNKLIRNDTKWCEMSKRQSL